MAYPLQNYAPQMDQEAILRALMEARGMGLPRPPQTAPLPVAGVTAMNASMPSGPIPTPGTMATWSGGIPPLTPPPLPTPEMGRQQAVLDMPVPPPPPGIFPQPGMLPPQLPPQLPPVKGGSQEAALGPPISGIVPIGGGNPPPGPPPGPVPDITRVPPPPPLPPPTPGSGGTPGWLSGGGSMKTMLQNGLLASSRSLPGLLNRGEIPGQFGGSPFYGHIPWGMSPFDIGALIRSQGYDAFRQPPVKWKPPGPPTPPPPPPGSGGGGSDR